MTILSIYQIVQADIIVSTLVGVTLGLLLLWVGRGRV